MVNKDASVRDLNDKKRRKPVIVEITPTKISKEDVYMNVISFEEQESIRRPADQDSALFHKTCDELKKLFAEIAVLKKDNTEKAKQEIIEKRIWGSMLFVVLKKLNRLDKVRIRAGRDALHKEKLRVDSNRLQLQNLLYEADHLKREVQRCYQFKSQDEEIDLVSIEEFYAEAPHTISRPDKTNSDDHARRLARLEWEIEQRKKLASLYKERQSAKEKIVEGINSKTERLKSLKPCLKDLLKSTRPLQKALEMNIEKDWEIQKSARLLPRPLYLLYANMAAYAEACDNHLTVEISGDEDEARQLDEQDKETGVSVTVTSSGTTDDDMNVNGESENEDNDVETERSSKSHSHHRRQSKSAVLAQKRDNLFKAHPLCVTFTVKTLANTAEIAVKVQFLPALGFVTVLTSLSNIETLGIGSGDVIGPNDILRCLYPSDYGFDSPNPKSAFQLDKLGMSVKKLQVTLDDRKLGIPYRWAQRLCGLEFIGDHTHGTMVAGASKEVCQNAVPVVVKQIRARWMARYDLFKQIDALEHGDLEVTPNDAMPSIRLASKLMQWVTVVWQDYALAPITQRFINEKMVNANDIIYRAVIARGTAKLDCLIAISCKFPADTPLWAITLTWNGTEQNALNNACIRDMERCVNAVCQPRKSAAILAAQLRQMMCCLDIYLETESPLIACPEFSREKTFLKAFRGRQRTRPYRIVANGDGAVITHF